jgi:hypothetical protein
MSVIHVGVVNMSRLDGGDVERGIAALSEQLDRDFGPIWGIDAMLEPEASLDGLRSDQWALVLSNGGVTGDITPKNMPGTVVDVDVPLGHDWTHAASHQLLEMLASPLMSQTVLHRAEGSPPRLFAREICDPCAAYEDGYGRGGRQVSDFVFPGWFGCEGGREHGEWLDERHTVRTPFAVRKGGYAVVLDLETWAWLALKDDDRLHAVPADIDRRVGRLLRALFRNVQDDQWSGPVKVIGGPH